MPSPSADAGAEPSEPEPRPAPARGDGPDRERAAACRERLASNLAGVRERMRAACAAAAREDEVRLLAVTKYVTAEAVAALAELGVSDVAENYVQAGIAKRAEVAAPLRWHLIGPLQSNKARKAVEAFDLLRAIDRRKLVDRLATLAGELRPQRPLPISLQLNVTGEASKSGCEPAELEALATAALAHPQLELAGVMAMGPTEGDPRAAFELARETRDAVAARLGRALPLSLGMSADLELAIAFGSDEVRVGGALFAGLEPWFDPARRRPEVAR